MFLVSVELAPVRATLEIDFVRFAVFDGEDVGDSWPGCACPWVSHLRSGACLRHSRVGLDYQPQETSHSKRSSCFHWEGCGGQANWPSDLEVP